MDAKTVGKAVGDVEAQALVKRFPDTLSEMVSKTTANSLTCVEDGKPDKKEADTLAREEAYTVVDTLNEVKAKALVYTQPQTISH